MTSEIRSSGDQAQPDGNSEAASAASLPAIPEYFLNPATGEIVPATPENAASILAALRKLRFQINEAAADCRYVIAEESKRQGTKTLRFDGMTVQVSGGSELVWDVEALEKGLSAAGCPQERIDALITATVEYKVNQTVARQLAGANPEYAKAIEAAKERVTAPISVSVKGD